MIDLKITIHGDKIKVTDSIKEYIEGKISKLEKYLGNAEEVKATAVIRVLGPNQIIEVTVPTGKYTLRSEERHKDLYAAVDLVVDKLERQIRKNKTRITTRERKDSIANMISDFTLDFEEKEENDNKIIRRKSLEMRHMDEEEAILQMELLNHDFFIFNNIDEECVSVLYKRKDDHYGIINAK